MHDLKKRTQQRIQKLVYAMLCTYHVTYIHNAYHREVALSFERQSTTNGIRDSWPVTVTELPDMMSRRPSFVNRGGDAAPTYSTYAIHVGAALR